MKNSCLVLAFILVGSLAFASNIEVDTINDNTTIENMINLDDVALKDITSDIEMNKIENILSVDTKEDLLGCSSTTVTTTTVNPDGSSTSTTTTTVECDTPQELAIYHAAMQQLGIKR